VRRFSGPTKISLMACLLCFIITFYWRPHHCSTSTLIVLTIGRVTLPSIASTCDSDDPLTGEIHPLPPHLILNRQSTDLTFILVGPLSTSNELMLASALYAFHDAVSLLLRGQVEKRNVLEGLDLVLLAADETIDDG
jgi:hypothetical protein